MHGPVLTLLVITTLLAFGGAMLLPWSVTLPPAAHVHLALAVGAMPLILAAISHFIPVLTRGKPPAPAISFLPLLALAAGFAAFYSFTGYHPAFRHGAAALGFAAGATLAFWIWRRGKTALGRPHPCLYWYLAAVGCLVLALLLVPLLDLWPAGRLAIKRLHLHLNTLGFIGLTALGTLQVLLPTATGAKDAGVTARLHADLKWALAGTLLTAVGAAWFYPLSWLGLTLWLRVLWRTAAAWAIFRPQVLAWHGSPPALAAALLGFTLALAAGLLHTGGYAVAAGGAHLFIIAFLFPLVSGAASQLLPVWLRPGRQTGWHAEIRRRLTRWGGLRALLFLVGGALSAAGWISGLYLALAGLGLFLLQLAGVMLTRGRLDAESGSPAK